MTSLFEEREVANAERRINSRLFSAFAKGFAPAPGYTMEAATPEGVLALAMTGQDAPKPQRKWADSPLSSSELNRAKLLLAQKLDTSWEDR